MSEPWSSESVPDEDQLFRWVHRQWFSKRHGGVSPTFFKNAANPLTGQRGMSTDWSRYATAEESQQRAKDPSVNGVIELTVADVRAIPEQVVEHTPIQPNLKERLEGNRAHTDVFGPKEEDPEIQRAFARLCRVVIPAPE